jgi:hypothetical protein
MLRKNYILTVEEAKNRAQGVLGWNYGVNVGTYETKLPLEIALQLRAARANVACYHLSYGMKIRFERHAKLPL